MTTFLGVRVKKKFTKYFEIQFFILWFKVFGVGGLGPVISIFMKIAGNGLCDTRGLRPRYSPPSVGVTLFHFSLYLLFTFDLQALCVECHSEKTIKERRNRKRIHDAIQQILSE